MESGDGLPPVDCFLSYRRADNEAYRGVVDRLKSDLSGRFEAETGRKLRIFIDRDDIGWGQDWRQKIFDSIRTATFLIPVITMRYFESEACREEFMAFFEDAKQIGVTDLIMPVVLAGGSRITADSSSEEMRIVFNLQHISIEEAFLEGFDSPEWNRQIGRMVRELAKAVDRAETTLENRESRSARPPDGQSPGESLGDEYADMQELQRRMGEVRKGIENIENDLNAVMAVINPLLDSSFWQLSSQAQKATVLSAANELREPAAVFAGSSSELEDLVSGIDSGIRLAIDELREMSSPQAQELVNSVLSTADRSADYVRIVAAMPTITDGLRMLGMTNINMRKAIQPVIRGFQSMQRVAEIMDSWSRFRDIN